MKFLPMADRLGEIRRLYFATTRATIEADFEKALELLKGMESEEERSRATVFMHGLAQMKADWGRRDAEKTKRPPRPAPRRGRT
jgi:predicted translin family RNA/ssDNA-binding protein